MRRKFEELRENLEEFVQQDEYPMLVVGCLTPELAYVVKFLQSLQDTHGQHWFVIFAQPFESAARYLDAVVASVQMQVEAAGPLRVARGEAPFPPLPSALFASEGTVEQRLHDLLCYLRTLLPAEDGHRVVVGLLPASCSDDEAYARLIASVVPLGLDPPWMDATRIVAYDDRSRHWLTDAMQKRGIDRVLTFDVDFSTPALADALGREAADPALPMPQRMASLMQLAALDFSYKRYPDAIDKYAALHAYYHAARVPEMAALALLGAGDAERAAGRPEQGQERLQQGIAVAMQHTCLPVLLNLLMSATQTCMELRRFADAVHYADAGTRVAAAVLNPFAYADLFEMKGDAQCAGDDQPGALESYRRCAEVCRTYEYAFRWTSVLEREKALCARLQLPDDEQAAAEELESVRALASQPAVSGAEGQA